PMVLWDAMAAERACGDAIAAFVADPADAAGALVGQSGAVVDANDRTALVGVYVTPAWRGTGLIARLVEAVAQWSLSVGRSELSLYVADGNPRAVRAYERLGFAFSGHVMEHPFHPRIVEREMIRPAAWPAPVGGGQPRPGASVE
ncbi:MAG TPA: GNAT family N-acetyltransferase, partial [Cryptosporangiaceae bacterium]|nr:GNAT family N-acetyltransferase [Cryptosporangiaceae bacterium]